MMVKNLIRLSIAAGLLATVVLVVAACGGEPSTVATQPTQPAAAEGDAMMTKLPDKLVAPHFVDSVPNHGDVLPRAPNSITLNFNFNLHADSSIALNRDGKPVALGAKPIASNQLAITAPVSESNAPDGVYTVNYKACWPDRSCHEGSVSFVVDSTARSSFIDLRGRS